MELKLKIVLFLFNINFKIGRRLLFYKLKYSAEGDVGEAIQKQKLDLRGMKDRMKAVMLHDQDIIDKRWSICQGCEHFVKATSQCDVCKCFMKIKTRVATVSCPLDPPKWDKEYDFLKNKEINGTQPVIK